MEEAKIRQIVQQELQRSNNAARFGVNNIPFHTHDGVNSPKIKEENIIPAVSVSGNITFAREDTYTIYLNSSFTPSSIQLYGIAYNLTGTFTFTMVAPETVTAGTLYEVGGITFRVITTAVDTLSVTMTPLSSDTPPSTGTLDKVAGTGSGSSYMEYSSVSDGTTIGARCQIIGSANLGPSFYLQPGSNSSVITGDIQFPFVNPELEVVVPLQSATYIWVQSGPTFRALSSEGHIVSVQAGSTIYARATITEFNRDKVAIVVSQLEPDWYIVANLVIT